MSGPPIEIHLMDEATPKVVHTPSSVPIHWQEQVQRDLVRDEALHVGVIEKVPYGEPVTLCHHMVVTRKHDGSPRLTMDLSPVNKSCKQETLAGESPFHLARRVPKGTWKTVCDAWNGHHSVPLRDCDRHLTTFIPPSGAGGTPGHPNVLCLLGMATIAALMPFCQTLKTGYQAAEYPGGWQLVSDRPTST